MVHLSLFHPLWVFAVERFSYPFGPELLATLVFGLGLCSAGIGVVCPILCGWQYRHSQFGWGVQLRLEYHPNPGVVLFPDLLFQRVLDSVSLTDFEVLIGTFLF